MGQERRSSPRWAIAAIFEAPWVKNRISGFHNDFRIVRWSRDVYDDHRDWVNNLRYRHWHREGRCWCWHWHRHRDGSDWSWSLWGWCRRRQRGRRGYDDRLDRYRLGLRTRWRCEIVCILRPFSPDAFVPPQALSANQGEESKQVAGY